MVAHCNNDGRGDSACKKMARALGFRVRVTFAQHDLRYSRPRVKPSLLAFCCVAMSTIACGGAADIPETPDLRALVASYDRPSAALTSTTVADALNSVPRLKELAAGFKAAEYVLDDVNNASETSSTKTGSRLRLQGSIGLKVRCPGESSNPNFDESVNGSISLTLAVADNRIRRSMAGQGHACVLKGTVLGIPARTQLDGEILFDLGGDIGIGQRWSGNLLISVPGELRVGDFVFESVSGRFVAGHFQYLAQLPMGGTIVLEVGDDGITIYDGTGAWFCREGESCAKR